MKRTSLIFVFVLLTSMVTVALPKPAIAADPQFYFDPNPGFAHVGQDITIAVKLDQVTDLVAYELGVMWNPRVLKYKSIQWGWLEGEDVGDFNLDHVVDSTDLGIMGAAWGSYQGDSNYNPLCDINNDGLIDSIDLGYEGVHWGDFAHWTWKDTYLPIYGNELDVAEWYDDLGYASSSATPVTLVNITWTAIAGGNTNLEFSEHSLWTFDVVPIASTATNGYFCTYEPVVGFSWTAANAATYHYTGPRIGETVTFDGSASYSADGDTITGYSWSIDDQANGTGVTTTGRFGSYNKTAHDVALTVTDSGGHSYTLHKPLTIDRDISILSIWPSMEDYQGSIETTFVSGKYVAVLVRTANVGTITEYTNNTFGDFPATAQLQLWWIHEDGSEQLIYTRTGGANRRYWSYTEGDTQLRHQYDWQPTVGVSNWAFFELWGAAPETNCYLKANFTDAGTGQDPFAGDTDLSNNELWFGPFDIVAGSGHDIRIEWIYNVDNGYYTPIQPYGTTYKYGYGGKYLNPVLGTMGPIEPIGPGNLTDVYVDMSNVGIYDENVTWHVYANGVEIHSETDVLDVGTGYFTFVFTWDTTGYYGTYTLQVYVEPVSGETGRWATWDNNTPENINTYGIKYFNAYDDWIISYQYTS